MNSLEATNLAWAIIALIAAWAAGGWILDWLDDRYEVCGFRVTRRWYGAAAHVILQSADDDPDRYAVLDWRKDESQPVPWLLVHKLDPEYLTFWDEDAEAFWAPVTDFAPYAVRRIRPYLYKFGPVPLPRLTKYVLLSGPDLGERLPPAGLTGDQLELTPPGRMPLVAGEPAAQMPLQDAGETFPGRVGDNLDGVLAAPVAEHLKVKGMRAGHGSQGNPATGG